MGSLLFTTSHESSVRPYPFKTERHPSAGGNLQSEPLNKVKTKNRREEDRGELSREEKRKIERKSRDFVI